AIGNLGQSLEDGADQMAYERQVRQDIRNALTYPTILVGAGFTAVLFIFIVVVPRFSAMLANAKGPLPWISAVVLKTGMFFSLHKTLILGSLVAGGVAIWHLLRSPSRRSRAREAMARLPMVGSWLREAEIARWASMLGTMLANGVDLLKGL